MFYPFLCGAFHHQEEEEGDEIWSTSPARSPGKSKRKRDTKNPYSTRGLDQFSALLAELEEKRQKIYSQTGSQSVVRFVYNKSNDCVPVVINLQDNNEEKTKQENTKRRYVSEAINKVQTPSESDKNINLKSKKTTKEKRFSWKIVQSQNLRKPSYYIPVIIILILLFLMFVGRPVAILCTCVGWYIVPTINGEASNLKNVNEKERLCEKREWK